MLKLGRNPGERTRIECPDGSFIWVTQGIGCCTVEQDGLAPLIADYESDVYIDLPCGGEIQIQYNPYNPKHSNLKIGIQAPQAYLILREELIDQHQRETP